MLPLFLLLVALAPVACRPPTAPPSPSTAAAAAVLPTASSVPENVTVGPSTPRPTVMPSPTGTASPTVTPSPTNTPVPTPCTDAGRVISNTFHSATAGSDYGYRVYLPPCYGKDGRVYPTLILMAGNIHDESKWDELGIDEAATAAIVAGAIPPMLIVMPDGGWLANNTSGGPGSYERLILDDLLPHVEATYCAWVDPAGRAIGGLSRGGYWALEIAFRFPDLFASAGGHSAALLDQYAGPTVNPRQTGIVNDLGDLRVYLDIGADDYLRANTIRLHEDMEAAGVPHTWHLNEGRHEDAYWANHVTDYLNWYATPWPSDRDHYPPCK